MSDRAPKIRKNGFVRPLGGFQIASWIVFGLNLGLFSIFCAPLILQQSAVLQALLITLFLLGNLVLFTAAHRATSCTLFASRAVAILRAASCSRRVSP